MLNRRTMFAAITTALGASAIGADHAVAIAFGDEDYLRERAKRLAAHEAELAQKDAEWRAFEARTKKEQAICDTYTEQALRANAYGQTVIITMSYDHYALLNKNNMIDFIPNSEGETMVPSLHGQLVQVQ